MSDTSYADAYRNVDFRKHPEKYRIGKGEQGVLMAEPYKSEILPHWRFATPDAAQQSASTIFDLFLAYKQQQDFVGMDMARKFLQMGFTRSRRYANHSSGHKYDSKGHVLPQDKNSEDSPKAESARIFSAYYKRALADPEYANLKKEHIKKSS